MRSTPITVTHTDPIPKCGAKTRAGTPCDSPAISSRGRCRLHGGLSPGAPRGPKNGNFKNGDWTAGAIEERKWLRSLVQSFAMKGMNDDGKNEQRADGGGRST
jgi:hypothetical protein